MIRDFRVALLAAWVIVSVVLFGGALAPLLVPGEWLFRVSPVCEAKKRGGSCVLCGMTTAYAAIGRGDFAAAHSANAGSLAFWSGSVLNFQAAVAYVVLAVRKRRFRGGPACKCSP